MQGSVKFIRNGMNVKFLDNEKIALSLIEEHMSNASVSNAKIYDGIIHIKGKPVRMIIYQYYTLYREIFTIEEA